MVCFKSGLTADIVKLDKSYDSGEEAKAEVSIYSAIKCHEIKTSLQGGSLQATWLAEHTKKAEKVYKIGKENTLVKIGMKLTVTDSDLGELGTFLIEDVQPVKNKGRLHGIYLHCNRYNS